MEAVATRPAGRKKKSLQLENKPDTTSTETKASTLIIATVLWLYTKTQTELKTYR